MSTWRPCCGNCRSERLVERDERGGHFLACEDCGAMWDGSHLTPDEQRDRPKKPQALAAFLGAERPPGPGAPGLRP